ncbi:DUF3783 domain-containing protein [Anaeromassilibacillus sp. SJQ-5]
MKARIPVTKDPAAVLLYGADESTREKLAGILKSMGLPYRLAQAGQEGESVGYLLGLAGYAHTQAAASDLVPETCLVMCGLEEAQLDGLLGAMKAAGIIIPFKAIATPHNKGWSLAQLMRELRRERDALRPV